MTVWLSLHGAGVIKPAESSFNITPGEIGSVLRPTDVNALTGSIIFPMPNLPQNALKFVSIEVSFTACNARVDEVAIICDGYKAFQKKSLRKIRDFNTKVSLPDGNIDGLTRGLALSIQVEFQTVSASLEFRWAGLEIAVSPTLPVASPRCESGTWNVMDVRPWDEPREKTEGWIGFSKEFESPPIVMLSLTGVDIGNEANSRVKVYTSEVTSHGFTVHADSWGNTKLYSCGASWIALGH
ncbi:hypothetical protein BELL_0349g00030 [Botrytis elliptica]|uniref:H-type lectin domain-containing protein n=1 Tax=Botrytis elliptica TaxID=278938 RepID=A0A4Z1JXB9_9HELO|nr:hypothetical protein EAE99_008515 [Botrytis elliptica]TGO73577.1 hypothetical protein BELL_0349g00030 [Botrytis elliptica]